MFVMALPKRELALHRENSDFTGSALDHLTGFSQSRVNLVLDTAVDVAL